MRKLSPGDILIPVAIIIAGAMISGSIVWTAQQAALQQAAMAPVDLAAPPGQQPAPPADIAEVKTDGAAYIGKADAPVVMAYWFDLPVPLL